MNLLPGYNRYFTYINSLNHEQLLVQSRNTSDFVSKNKFSDKEILANYKTQYVISGSHQIHLKKHV